MAGRIWRSLRIVSRVVSRRSRSAKVVFRHRRRPSLVQHRKHLWRLLLDSRVVDLPMAYNPIFVTLSSLKPLFFNGLKNEF
jgi:hypothetical protein